MTAPYGLHVMGHVFNRVLLMSFQATVLIVLVALVLRLCGRRLSPRWRYLVWMLVLVRLAIPWAPGSHLSIFSLAGIRHCARSPVFYESTLNAHPSPLFIKEPLSGDIPAGVVASAGNPGTGLSDASATSGPARSETGPRIRGTVAAQRLLRAVPVVWLWGMAVLALRLVFNHVALASQLRRKRPVTDTRFLDLLEDCKEEMGLHTPITLLESDRLASPALLGFIRPCFVVNPGVFQNFTRGELRHVLLHELAHLRRFDIPAAWVMECLRIVHWFNPIAALALTRIRAEREAACDALVLARVRGDESRPYGETLLKLMRAMPRPALAAGFMGISERREAVRNRIRLIGSFPTRKGRNPILALGLMLLLSVVGLTDARRTHPALGPSRAPQGRLNLLRLSGHKEIDPALRRFAAVKGAQTRTMAEDLDLALEPEANRFFQYAQVGDWLSATAFYQQLQRRDECSADGPATRQLNSAVRYAAQEVYMAFEQFAGWDQDVIRSFARDVLKGTDEKTVLFGGTDAGRAIVTAFNEIRPESNIIIIAQHALDDPTYVSYLRLKYQDRLAFPSLTHARGEPDADALAEDLFERHRNTHTFLVEEGEVMPWMQSHLVPHGLVMRLNAEAGSGPLPGDIVAADRRFWNSRTNELVENPSAELVVQQNAAYARLRAAIGGIYEFRGMKKETEHVYQQARLLCPGSVDVALRLADFYAASGRDRECLAVLLDIQQSEPASDRIARNIQGVSERIRHALARDPHAKEGTPQP